jgi:hypothetical protein
MNPETSEALFMDPEEVVPLMEALSFTQYLLQQYGYDMFAGIYNEEDIQEKIKAIYGKSVTELEVEWLTFINQEQFVLDEEEWSSIFE